MCFGEANHTSLLEWGRARAKDRAREETNRPPWNVAIEKKSAEVDALLQGWANYCRHGVSKRTFSTVDSFIRWRLSAWIRRRHPSIGLRESRRRFTDRDRRLAYQESAFRDAFSVTVIR